MILWDFIVIQWYINRIYPLVNVYSLLLKMAIEIVDFPINSMVDLSIVMLNYQRVLYTIWLFNIAMENHHF